ncbi:hypothetical protein GTA51_09880 [Desulfovibrio aerotolerans]|uniref:Uncharacterized protein n=1 Tax=Solidesulfovibrio aerotolerans TaxID=295255 RepID=A0A7C9MVA4_9BACT|nr:hypothetical protein [Solidesulfovibrio aerotolerans]MYL83434.1 hypothetical protein [Solidesulfovibrio aerotolerans]
MVRRTSCWLVVAAVCCLVATIPVQSANGQQTREVPIPGTGLSLHLPPGLAVAPQKPAHAGDATLSITVESLRNFPRDGVVTKAEVQAQRTALAKGQATVADGGGGEAGLAEVVALPAGGSAVLYPVYSEFEICDLRLELVAVFFAGERRVTLRYSLPPAAVVKEDPGYFGHDKANCGSAVIWRQPGPEVLKRFHEAVKAGHLGPAANAWYTGFRAVLASLQQTTPAR